MTLIKSMTGYGRAVNTVNGREFTVEIRSVNNRHLDCNIKPPRFVSFAEEEAVVAEVEDEAEAEAVLDVVAAEDEEDALLSEEGTVVTASEGDISVASVFAFVVLFTWNGLPV